MRGHPPYPDGNEVLERVELQPFVQLATNYTTKRAVSAILANHHNWGRKPNAPYPR
jgi:hypothetical protein